MKIKIIVMLFGVIVIVQSFFIIKNSKRYYNLLDSVVELQSFEIERQLILEILFPQRKHLTNQKYKLNFNFPAGPALQERFEENNDRLCNHEIDPEWIKFPRRSRCY